MNVDKPIRVLLVDDHPVVRDMVRLACSHRPSLEVVGEAADGIAALAKCRRLQPDVLVLNLHMPELDGFEVMRRLREMGSKVRILVLTSSDDGSAVFEALRLGVDGYMLKTARVEEITAAIEAVANGTQVFSVETERAAIAKLGEHVKTAREGARTLESLTGREREVLALIMKGLSTRQVATRLGLSSRTVETHVGNIYQKLGVRTRVQALYRAARLGLLDLARTSDA
jgi:DNA-binding NarL/FixJ family response regulator